MKLLRCLLVLMIVYGCQGNNPGNFLQTRQVVTQHYGFDSVYLKFPYRVRICDTLMYVSDLHAMDFYCHEFAFPSLKYRKSFAPRGKAPGELIGCANILPADTGLYLLDSFGKRICRWDGQKITTCTAFPAMGMVLDFAQYNDSLFIIPDFTGESRIKIISSNGEIVRTMGTIPTRDYPDAPAAMLGQSWRPFISYNARNGTLATATQLGDVLEVYDLKNNNPASMYVGSLGEPKPKGEKTFMGYGDVFVGDQYIYAIFWGHEMEKIKNGEITEQGGNRFRVFDLLGTPICEYQLDRYIMGFHINENTGEVWATDVNNEQLVTFRIDAKYQYFLTTIVISVQKSNRNQS